MKILRVSIVVTVIGLFSSCASEPKENEDVEISEETRQKAEDIGIEVGGQKDLDGDGIADVKLTNEGELVAIQKEKDDHAEMDDGEVEIDRDKTYTLEYDEEDQKWEIDVENEFEQTYEDAAKGVKDAANDVGEAVDETFDGDDE